MTAGGPIDRTGVGASVGGGDRGDEPLDPDRGAGEHAFPTGAPEHEPGAAELRPGDGRTSELAPEGEAPDLDDLQPGDGPGQTPGE